MRKSCKTAQVFIYYKNHPREHTRDRVKHNIDEIAAPAAPWPTVPPTIPTNVDAQTASDVLRPRRPTVPRPNRPPYLPYRIPTEVRNSAERRTLLSTARSRMPQNANPLTIHPPDVPVRASCRHNLRIEPVDVATPCPAEIAADNDTVTARPNQSPAPTFTNRTVNLQLA